MRAANIMEYEPHGIHFLGAILSNMFETEEEFLNYAAATRNYINNYYTYHNLKACCEIEFSEQEAI